MMLVEETLIPENDLPVAALKRHLRLGSGFAEDDVQDSVLGSFLRAAMSAIEARTGKVLMTRGFVLSLREWRNVHAQDLPIAPVQMITDFSIIDVLGVASAVDDALFKLEADNFVPRLIAMGACLPRITRGGAAEIRFQAGYGDTFEDLPADLAQAVLLLAAHYYEYRHETALSEGCMPFGVTSLIARYRNVRVGFGA